MSGLILIQLFDTLMVFLKEYLDKVDFEKKSADNKKACRLSITHWASRVIGPVKQKNQSKIAIIFLSITLNMCFGYSKDRLTEMVLLSTHNICFG